MSATATKLDYRQSLFSRIADARRRSDAIFETLAAKALYDRPIPERHRLVFYLGHLEAFDWNLFREPLDLKSENAALDKLFAFGIDPTNGKLPNDVPGDWPAESAVRAYNSQARDKIDAGLARAMSAETAGPDVNDGTLLNVAIEHRLMHVETLAYLLHQLPFERKLRPREAASASAESGAPVPARKVAILAGNATLGQPRHKAANSNGGHAPQHAFGWDNEFETSEIHVPGFLIDAYPVTNGQFLEFVRAGGYSDRNLWRPQDWEWISSAGIMHPIFWIPRGDNFSFRGMFEEQPLPLAAPVWASFAEASAYARWAGKSLPTEAQWHRAAYGFPNDSANGAAERNFPWGNESPAPAHGNFDFASWDPAAVAAHPLGASAFGVFDLLGNGWEWTSTPFAPLPGFEPFAFYRGYSADFFDGNHFVMKGGSQRTAACMLRRSFRNWFQPHYQYVYAKFRCVEG